MVVQYIAKYAAKSEPRSEFYKDLLQNILQEQLQPEADGRIAVQKLIIQAISERDISAQECCHLLMSLPLFHSSRTFVVLWVGTKSWDRWVPNTERCDEDLEEADDEEPDNQHSLLVVSYTKRPSEYETMNLLDLCAILYFFKKRWVRRRKAAVVRVLPRFCPDGPAKESFFKQQMMIKMPWRKLEDLNPLNDLWETIYTRHFGSSSTLCEDNSSDTGSSSSDSDANDTQNQFDEWMGLSALGPNGQLQGREPGTRDFDITFNWKATYPSYHSFRDVRSFITTCKDTHVNLPIQRTNVSIHFSLEQQKFIDLFQLQLAQLSSASNENPTSIHRVMVQGTAGTGKSTLIKHITTTLTATLGNSSFMLLAATGVAAYNVGGTTIHSALRIPIERKYFSQLSSAAEHDLQSQFQSCHFVIIDEFSMVGCALLSMIDKRLRQAKPGYSNVPFGNMFVYLFGDIMQLPPVMDRALYSKNANASASLANEGYLAYRSFTNCQILTNVQRQSGNSPEQQNFRNILRRLSTGTSTIEDWNTLATRFESALNDQERTRFRNAVQLEPTREKA